MLFLPRYQSGHMKTMLSSFKPFLNMTSMKQFFQNYLEVTRELTKLIPGPALASEYLFTFLAFSFPRLKLSPTD